jgi:hypothetical protein
MNPKDIQKARAWIADWRLRQKPAVRVADVETLLRWAEFKVTSESSHAKARHPLLKGFDVGGYGIGGHVGYAVHDGEVIPFYVKRLVNAVEYVLEQVE